MELQQLKNTFAVCKIASVSTIDLTNAFTFLSVTDDEISLVCEEATIPANATDVERNWVGLKICGILDFGMIGVIANISGLLAAADISIFVVSTFNTDYIFLKAEHYLSACMVLQENGYTIQQKNP